MIPLTVKPMNNNIVYYSSIIMTVPIRAGKGCKRARLAKLADCIAIVILIFTKSEFNVSYESEKTVDVFE